MKVSSLNKEGYKFKKREFLNRVIKVYVSLKSVAKKDSHHLEQREDVITLMGIHRCPQIYLDQWLIVNKLKTRNSISMMWNSINLVSKMNWTINLIDQVSMIKNVNPKSNFVAKQMQLLINIFYCLKIYNRIKVRIIFNVWMKLILAK